MIFKNTIKRFVLEEVEKEYKSGNYAAYAPFIGYVAFKEYPFKKYQFRQAINPLLGKQETI